MKVTIKLNDILKLNNSQISTSQKKSWMMMNIMKSRKILILALFLISFIILNPLHSVITHSYLKSDYKPTLAQPDNVLSMGVSAGIISGNWDPVITDGYNILEYYKEGCLEPLLWLPDDSTEPESQLASSWEYDYRPEELNSLGFNNLGGVEAINITLRNGVNFHDGSNWNATVAKWNIDRLFLITGNLTGNANGWSDQRNAGNYWIDVSSVTPYFTANWNLSEYDAPEAIPPGTPPDPSRYSYYYLTDPEGSSPVIVNNSNPYGGIDFGYFMHYAPYDKFPIVRGRNN